MNRLGFLAGKPGSFLDTTSFKLLFHKETINVKDHKNTASKN